jgi:hypothetical protein
MMPGVERQAPCPALAIDDILPDLHKKPVSPNIPMSESMPFGSLFKK